ncbi:NAD(P)H azoreductase [Baekduia alba]|uniref:NAD(P)H-binding protein n=1 Tax=Baekduia alba TaxID=2997333 RepID=UPI00233FAAFE|nr:NAD(P)H-binding protein [Baekduia alba]WCB95248.1 NAD(P)H azoreductase [Baekduia alba]
MIVITTPTGQIGREVLDAALASDEPVRVIARDPARLPADVRERAEVVQGSHGDLDVVTAALDGADSVFWLVPPDPHAHSLQEHVLGFVRPLCAAINHLGVQRVVAVSSLGRGIAKDAGQVSAIFAMDDLIESTGVAYRSLCPPGFMDNMLWQAGSIRTRGTLFLPLAADRRVPICAARDVAATAARLLLDETWSGQEDVPVLGPEDLSYAEIAQIMTEVLERPIRFHPLTSDAYKSVLLQGGMTEAWAQGLVAMAAAVDRGIYDDAPRTAQSTTSTTFRQWCEAVLKPAVLG